MSRRFQFSLRALLIVTTVTCVVLGCVVERANRRGAAIDAIAKGRSSVSYGDDVLLTEFFDVSHFWLDVKRVPVTISLGPETNLDATLGDQLKNAVPIESLFISNVRDDELRHLKKLNYGCSVVLFSDEKLSDEAIAALEQRIPNIEVIDVTGTTP